MTTVQFRVLLLWFLAYLAHPALGQSSKLFQWQFANSAIATSLPTCATLPIVVKSFDPVNITHGTPPYYMISFAVGGTPQTSLIGTDENNLSWTVTQPIGTQLALSVVDANGSAGGIPPSFFQVVAGQSTQCVVTPPTSPKFTVTANVTTHLTTCQPWGLTVKGGVPPYNVTLLQLNSPIVTNVTMPLGLDEFTFINRATPGLTLIAAISDFTGRWASGTPSVQPKGFDDDPACVGLVSQSGNSTQILQEQALSDAAETAAKRRRSTVIAVVTILIFLILGCLTFLAFLSLRKRRREAEVEAAETKARQFADSPSSEAVNDPLGPSPSALAEQPAPSRKAAILAEIHATRSNARLANSSSPASSQTGLLSDVQTTRVGFERSSSANATTTASSRTPSRASNRGFATFPTTSIRASGKLSRPRVLITTAAISSPESEYLETEPPDTTSGVAEEAVFQHQDAGGSLRVVRELPPPYALRQSRRASS